MKTNYPLQPTSSSKEPLVDSPRNVEPDFHKKPAFEKTGTSINLSMSSGGKYGSGTPDGSRQIVGTSLPLSKTPTLGYTSANTPMSERAVDSKKGY